jgi:hypothetical protein
VLGALYQLQGMSSSAYNFNSSVTDEISSSERTCGNFLAKVRMLISDFASIELLGELILRSPDF